MLRDFITVYLNNILVYTSGSRKDYIRLILDLKKYAFTIKEVKYLSYIIKVG
ncbi:hypothetical protein MYCTH_71609, partial [Thermothelomyces thermophilus ATCC 42464]